MSTTPSELVPGNPAVDQPGVNEHKTAKVPAEKQPAESKEPRREQVAAGR
jgi:hypothetical protein